VKVIHHLLDKGYKITIYPIWNEDRISVKRLASKASTKVLDLVEDIIANYSNIMTRYKNAKDIYHPRLKQSIQFVSNLLN